MQEPLQDHELSTPLRVHRRTLPTISTASSLAALVGPAEAFRNEVVAAFQVLRQVQEFGVIAELLEHVDGFERLGLFTAQESFDLWRDDEEAVELELEVGEVAEDDVLVLYRHYSFVSTASNYSRRRTHGISIIDRSFDE